MDDLPDELVLAILEAAGSAQVAGRVALVSGRYHSLAMDETLWHTIYTRQFGPPTPPPDTDPTVATAAEYRFQPNKGWRWNFMARTPATRPTCTGMLSMDGATYWGDIVERQPHGYGTLVQPPPVHSGWTAEKNYAYLLSRDPCAALECMSLYTGDWADGKRHGRGEGVWSNGARYEGDWVDDRCDGRGTMVYASGNHYRGGWSAGQRHGRGSYSIPKWDALCARLEGHFIAGRCVGDAVVRLDHRGTTWTGTVADGGFLGPVIVSHSDGTRVTAICNEDGLGGPYLLTDPDGLSFSCQHDGEWYSGGHGTLILADGRRRDGDWFNSSAYGAGIITYPDGSRWAGKWTCDDFFRSTASGATVIHGSSGAGADPCTCLACTDDAIAGDFDVDLGVFCEEPSGVLVAIRDSCKPE
ncbi:Morn repeat domain containing protein [Pandoravirus salinus]|uniref:Morn repeat domain containing protein n=1 Tax=Pandoravirus salinus TaxID=1349410 RepID=S4VUX9_9VIRU|nr:morn repeat domain [Pandoravirus salinus]AGO84374.1 Morn repeat domain containing protein [Pandoravirus salinus]